jgi:hypothetical protein
METLNSFEKTQVETKLNLLFYFRAKMHRFFASREFLIET